MSVAFEQICEDAELAVSATAVGTAELAAATVKTKPPASRPQLATAAPTRVRMTFIVQPFRLSPARELRTHASLTWAPII
jgi:fatty acid/phospholipid biosynthesis enzyme